MKVIVDNGIKSVKEIIPLLDGFEAIELIFLNSSDFNNSNIKDADALLIRSTVQINETLLVDTNVHFIGSATAGIDQVWSNTGLFQGETDVPVALVKSVGNIAKSDVTAFGATGDVLNGSGYKWVYGWLKQAPAMTYTTGGMIERSQEWWLNYWFTFDYPVYA